MKDFSYEILDSSGALLKGTVTAASRQNAVSQLARDGNQVVAIEEAGKGKKSSSKGEKLEKGQKIPLNDGQLVQFTEEMSDMLEAGMTIEKALEAMKDRCEEKKLRQVAEALYPKINEGAKLADALPEVSDSFSHLFCNLVLAGEESGSLKETLARQVKYLTTLSELRSKMQTTLIYPAFLIVSAVAVVALFGLMLVPRLEQLMTATGGTMPFFAQALSDGSVFVKEKWWQVIVVIVVLAILVTMFLQSPPGKALLYRFCVYGPMIGRLYRGFFNLHFTQTLSNLIGNGIHQTDALELTRGVTKNPILINIINQMIDGATKGDPLNIILDRAKIFDRALIDMARLGEDTGQLKSALEKASIRLDRNFNRAVERFTATIQPAITIIIAGIVGLMAYLMISIVQDTISTIRNQF